MKINVLLDKDAIMPTKAHKTDAGFDLYTPYEIEVPNANTAISNIKIPNTITSVDDIEIINAAIVSLNDTAKIGTAVIDTGVHIEIPEGYVGFLKSKSGLNVKKGITSEGVIDSGYTGSIVVKLYNHTDKPVCFKAGDKITQLVILPIPDVELCEVESLADTDRGNNGFGSSGR